MNKIPVPLRAFAALTAALLIASPLALADDPNDPNSLPAPSRSYDSPYVVASTWPGINFRLIFLRRILQNHLVTIFRIEATKDAPAGGTLIGDPGKLPPNIPQKMIAGYKLFPTAFMVHGASMTDELSHVAYPQVAPVAPAGYAYQPGEVIGTLHPGQSLQFSIQFMVPPPPPPPAPGQPPPVQTLSFTLPRATGAIVKVPLPPAEKTAAAKSP